MASETYDYEPLDNTDHTMKQIADAIRHKGYGKDVREAIAQGFEQLEHDINSHKPPFVTADDLKDINDRIDKANSRIDKLNERLDELLNGGAM